jgi:hypothetical protein
MNIWIQILITLIIVAIFFYFSVGFIVSWMNAEIFKSAGVGKLHWALNLVTLLIWPSMIKETLSGFKDTMALEIGKIAAAKSASSGDSAGGLGSMLGAMAGGLAGAAAGGPPNDTPESNTVAESN